MSYRKHSVCITKSNNVVLHRKMAGVHVMNVTEIPEYTMWAKGRRLA